MYRIICFFFIVISILLYKLLTGGFFGCWLSVWRQRSLKTGDRKMMISVLALCWRQCSVSFCFCSAFTTLRPHSPPPPPPHLSSPLYCIYCSCNLGLDAALLACRCLFYAWLNSSSVTWAAIIVAKLATVSFLGVLGSAFEQLVPKSTRRLRL